tara:strand:+ start:179 stop:625 length:447 start_codon:yes stop_codon:yes gene_type:complete
MQRSETQILNLLYLYAELIDEGRLEDCAALFNQARVVLDPKSEPPFIVDGRGLLEVWNSIIKLDEDGKPKTRHLVSNPILEIDEKAGTASARSVYSVSQLKKNQKLETIISGRYEDNFKRTSGTWQFSERTYFIDLIDDISEHFNLST